MLEVSAKNVDKNNCNIKKYNSLAIQILWKLLIQGNKKSIKISQRMIGINENIIKQVISNIHSFEIDVSFLNIIMTI